MKTDLIIILATNKRDVDVSTARPKLEIVGHYVTETDDQPGLNHVLKNVEYADERDFFALRISPDRSVSLQWVQAAPQFGPEIDAVGPHPTEPTEPDKNSGRAVRRTFNRRLSSDTRGPCWGCDNKSIRPDQHAGDCPKGVR